MPENRVLPVKAYFLDKYCSVWTSARNNITLFGLSARKNTIGEGFSSLKGKKEKGKTKRNRHTSKKGDKKRNTNVHPRKETKREAPT